MYMNHLEYHQRLIALLRKEIDEFPTEWELHPPIWPPPDWLYRIQDGLKVAEKETSEAYGEIKKMREMVRKRKVLPTEAMT